MSRVASGFHLSASTSSAPSSSTSGVGRGGGDVGGGGARGGGGGGVGRGRLRLGAGSAPASPVTSRNTSSHQHLTHPHHHHRTHPNHPTHLPPSPNFNMAKAKKFIGGLLRRSRSEKGDLLSHPPSSPFTRGRVGSQGCLSGAGRWGLRKGSATSTGSNESKENTPPSTYPNVGSSPLTPIGGSMGPKHKSRPWRRHSSPWRSMTSAERDGIKKMLRIATEADGQRGDTGHLEKMVICMVDQVDRDVDVTAVVDAKQRLHLMQWSVINGWHCLLELLLQRGHPADTENVWCNGPLHLACKLGDVHSAELLLRYGASTNTKSTACYPSNSLHLMHDSPYGPSAYCYIHLNSTPLQIALTHDSVNVVKLFLERTTCAQPVENSLILHTACRCRADTCIEYLLKTAPGAVNVRNPKSGETPLSISLQEGESTARTLLQSSALIDADVLVNCTGQGDSALHCLYVTDKCPNVLSLTLMLQDRHGDLVNCQDRTGNTPLHFLCSRLSRLGQRSEINLEYLPDIYLCTRHLLDHVDNPNVVNKWGQSALHMLYSGGWVGFQHEDKFLEAFLSETNKILRLLLAHGVDPNASSAEVCTVVNTIINQCCALGPEKAKRIGHNFIEAIESLCTHSADLNSPDKKGIYMLTRLLTACNRMLVNCVGETEGHAAKSVFVFISKILRILFGNGMSPPEDILRISVKQLAIITITQFDESGFGKELKEVAGLILCSGLNPNTLKVMSGGQEVDDIKTDDLRYCVARAFATHRDHQGMMKFFSIFEETLDQDKLNQLNRTICQILCQNFHESFFKNIGATVARLQDRRYRPRPLKQLCRIAINNSLQWNVSKRKHDLPLPNLLQDYLTTFH